MTQQIISVGKDELDGWDIRSITDDPGISIFVYAYTNEGYEGSGFAIYKQGTKYGYSYLGHCSCNGPLDDLGKAVHTKTEIKRIVNGLTNWEKSHAVIVLEKFLELTKR